MRKTILCLTALALSASVAVAGSADPKALRSMGDTATAGAVWDIDAGTLGDSLLACDNAGGTTIVGAAYVGAISVFGFDGDQADPQDSMIQDMTALVLLSADDLHDGDAADILTNEYSINFNNSSNFGITFQLAVNLLPDAQARDMFEAQGPFGGGFTDIQYALTTGRADRSLDIVGESALIDFGFDSTTNVPMDAGSSAGANSGAASVGAFNAAAAAAIGGADINTLKYSCNAGGVPDQGDINVTSPIALTVGTDDGQVTRYQSWMPSSAGFVDNILVLGGDETEPSNITVTW